jgi:anti-repressor protein
MNGKSTIGYSNSAKAVIDHCKGVTVLETPTQSGIQPIKYGKESEVYRLTMKSKLPNAEKFQDWVCDEVLPSIRKHGAYMTQETLEKALTSPDFLIQLATNLKEEKQKRIEAEQKAELAEQTIKSNAPKVLFADAVSTSQRSCLVAELAKILQQNGVNIGQNRLFAWMRENGYLCSTESQWTTQHNQFQRPQFYSSSKKFLILLMKPPSFAAEDFFMSSVAWSRISL